MVVTCAFYGFLNRTTKVTLQVDRETLEVGQSFTFEGDDYVILSVFEADDHYRANVGLEHLHRRGRRLGARHGGGPLIRSTSSAIQIGGCNGSIAAHVPVTLLQLAALESSRLLANGGVLASAR
jgi:hypothetical protein